MTSRARRLAKSKKHKCLLTNAYCWYLGGCIAVLKRINERLGVPTGAEIAMIENLIRRMRRYYERGGA